MISLAVAAAGWVGSSHPEITPPSNFHHLRDTTLDRMAERLAAWPEVLDRRRESVEHPFGSVKQWMGQGAFLMRGLESVRAEFSLTAIAYNLRRAITLIGIPATSSVPARSPLGGVAEDGVGARRHGGADLCKMCLHGCGAQDAQAASYDLL